MTEQREFPFPHEITRRERLTFSRYAHMQIQELGNILSPPDGSPPDFGKVSVEAETALLLIAAQRVDPSITFEDCLDHDDWVLAPPPELGGDDPLGDQGQTSSLPAPTASTS